MFQRNKSTHTLKDHNAYVNELIKQAEKIDMPADNELDAKNADQQIWFAKELYKLSDEFVNIKTENLFKLPKKISLGKNLSKLPETTFGEDEIPKIVGCRSAEIANKLLKESLSSFMKIEFSYSEVKASEKLGGPLGIPSIPEQVKKAERLTKELESRIYEFDKNCDCTNRKFK